MTNPPSGTFTADETQTGTILTALRQWLPGQSWSAVRKLLQSRRVAINGVLCLDEARRLSCGESVTIAERSLPRPPGPDDVTIRFVDRSIVVVEKPAGMVTLRRTSELSWSPQRRSQQPTLDEAVAQLIARHAADRSNTRIKPRLPRLFAVHRIDRDTSGLLVFARHESAQTNIIRQFAQHDTVRKYLALIPGRLPDQTICSQLIRDRGDGLRGARRTRRLASRRSHISSSCGRFVTAASWNVGWKRAARTRSESTSPNSGTPSAAISSIAVPSADPMSKTRVAVRDSPCTPRSCDSFTRRPANSCSMTRPGQRRCSDS